MPGSLTYGPEHRALRRRLAPAVEAGLYDCARCHLPIKPGEKWDLGHDDDDRQKYRGPEHRRCNRGTAGRPNHRRDRHSRKW